MTAPALTPMSIEHLLGRVHHEWTSRKRIFDLPSARFWRPVDDVDLSIDFLGRRAASPVGPAAGPHSQMAQNIVLAWLGGARLFELKTVQVMDDLEISRPCIDMQTVGYNIEWSQELRVHESLAEYVKAWLILEVLRRWVPLADHLGPDPGPHVFDLSVGYDLDGIRGDKVRGFIDGMRDASSMIDALRRSIPAPFDRDVECGPVVSDTVTLSTFHGCPPDEIEAITRHLIDEHELDVIVKLNPTLLGHARVAHLLHDVLGYRHVELVPSAFDEDLRFDRAIDLIGELSAHAARQGRRFGVKLTNTLVVSNPGERLPENRMYLSGQPLHVLAMAVAKELAAAIPGRLMLPGHDGDIQVSFSAGISKENIVDAVATGVQPATICSDLLRPGGYGRIEPMLRSLADAVRASGSSDLSTWRAKRLAECRAEGHDDIVNAHFVAITTTDVGSYDCAGTSKLPRAVDHDLEMFGCVACNFCVTVCPNDAFFRIPTGGLEGLAGRQQYLVFSELCNECGNCMTFCPERGDPALIKPRLYIDSGRFESATGPRFLLGADGKITNAIGDGAARATAIVQQLLDSSEGLPLDAVSLGDVRA